MHAKLLQEMHENEPLKEKIKAIENESGDKIRSTFDEIWNILDDRQALIMEYEANLKNQKSTMIAEFSHIDIEEHIIEFFQSLFIVKKKLTDRRIIHYFEWGNKNIHFYDVVNWKQTKYLVDFDKYIPKFCWTVVTDHGRLFCIAGRH